MVDEYFVLYEDILCIYKLVALFTELLLTKLFITLKLDKGLVNFLSVGKKCPLPSRYSVIYSINGNRNHVYCGCCWK